MHVVFTCFILIFVLTRMTRQPLVVFSAVLTSFTVMLIITPFRCPVVAMRNPPSSPKNSLGFLMLCDSFSRSSFKEEEQHFMHEHSKTVVFRSGADLATLFFTTIIHQKIILCKLEDIQVSRQHIGMNPVSKYKSI